MQASIKAPRNSALSKIDEVRPDAARRNKTKNSQCSCTELREPSRRLLHQADQPDQAEVKVEDKRVASAPTPADGNVERMSADECSSHRARQERDRPRRRTQRRSDPGAAVVAVDELIIVTRQPGRRSFDHPTRTGIGHHHLLTGAVRYFVANTAHQLLRRGEE
jgi:hypothetical protein